MNLLDLIQERWPNTSEKDADSLLWITPFPFVSLEKIVASLDEMKTKWDNNIHDVINGEMADFDAEFQKYRKTEASEGAIP